VRLREFLEVHAAGWYWTASSAPVFQCASCSARVKQCLYRGDGEHRVYVCEDCCGAWRGTTFDDWLAIQDVLFAADRLNTEGEQYDENDDLMAAPRWYWRALDRALRKYAGHRVRP